MEYSFVIPVHNEAANVAALHAELVAVAEALGKKYEILFVNDGSSDQTQAVLETLTPITIIELRRNFGQTASLDAGIKAAQGKYIITLDGDGQNDPASIPAMIEVLHTTGADVVCGWRKKRKDNLVKRFVSQGAKVLRSFLINDGIHDSGCTLRVYKAECFTDVTLRGQMHRLIPAILKWRGFSLREMEVHHRPRQKGESNYNWTRTVTGFLDMLNLWFFHKFRSRPLHLLGSIGGVLFIVGSSILLILAIGKVLWDWKLSDKIWPLMAVFFVLFGFQMFVSGLIMELMSSFSNENFYAVKKITHHS